MDSGHSPTGDPSGRSTTLHPRWSASTRRLVLGLAAVLATVLVATALFTTKGCRRNLDTRIGVRKRYAASTTGPIRVAEDWPKWRGPRGDGISRETNLADKWPDAGPPRLWEADAGLGYSSPVAAGGRVYLFSMDNRRETLSCFDALTGDVVWNNPATDGWTGDYPGARATPTIDGDAVFTYGGAGDLVCRNLSDGQPRWQVNVLKLTGSSNMQWGSASSPLVAGGLVYVQSGNGGPVAVAVNRDGGSLAWQSEFTGSGSYAHPILVDVQGTPQLVVFSGSAVVGMNPLNGKTIWSVPWATSYQVNASTPIYSNGQLFITSSYGQGCMLLQLSPGGPATQVWKNNEIKSRFQQAVLDNGHLYANSEGRLKCVEWATGRRKWTTSDEIELGDNGSLVRAGDKLVLMGQAGRLSLGRATPEKFELLGTAKVFEPERDEVWSTPLLYGGRLYAKGYKELVCFDVSAQPAR